MLPDGTIAADQLWKRFRADRQRWLLRDEIERLGARLRGNEERGWRWALRDVSLHAEPGESIGLIGDNGSGKTTLLKILTGVMYPYAGRVRVQGRVGALIEVRAGIHPELTGRENVYLFGSLLGLSRRVVSRRFDEIVAFAEVESAIDRQVKFYSTGMQMRVGFAVAAFLQPDALLVDEVLAVGDASFQQKCLDRMRWMLGQGTTLVFVSHDLAAVEATCSRCLWLNDGLIEMDDSAAEVLSAYRRSIEEAAEALPSVGGLVRIGNTIIRGVGGGIARSHGPLDVELTLESQEPRPAVLCLGISEGPATPIFLVRKELHLNSGRTLARCTIPSLPLPRGRYYLWAAVFEHADLMPWHPVAHFDVAGPELDEAPRAVVRLAPVHVDATWDVAKAS
jgi:ABC-type polysaccharide/polyol phosphate transport system ATPase subunit